MADYQYWFALDHAAEPWTGPYRSNQQARLAASRDGGRARVRFIRACQEVGFGATLQVGMERIEPGAE